MKLKSAAEADWLEIDDKYLQQLQYLQSVAEHLQYSFLIHPAHVQAVFYAGRDFFHLSSSTI